MGYLQTCNCVCDKENREDGASHFEFRELLVLGELSLPLSLWLRRLHLSHQMPVNHGEPRLRQPDWNKYTLSTNTYSTEVCSVHRHINELLSYRVTPPKTTAPTTSPLQPSSHRPTMRFVAALGTEDAVRVEADSTSAVMVLWLLFTSHCRSCGLRCWFRKRARGVWICGESAVFTSELQNYIT